MPVEQVQQFNKAFNNMDVASSQPLFDDLAIAEPPATRALRTGIDALRQYSQVLVLAEGHNIEQARMQLRTLGQ